MRTDVWLQEPGRRIITSSHSRSPIAALRGISKSIAGVYACRGIDLEIFAGDDRGEISVSGKVVEITSVSAALASASSISFASPSAHGVDPG
jgi:hypothetical protein